VCCGEEEQARFAALDADVAVVAAWPDLPRPILAAPLLGCLNVVARCCPGGAGPHRSAGDPGGDAVTGVGIMQMEAGLDGPVKLGTPRSGARRRAS
jgi:methionyl-tRNA formyltransferase